MSPRALTALVFMVAGLLVVVVVVGLFVGILDATGVAYGLITLLTGVVSGLILDSKKRNGGDGK